MITHELLKDYCKQAGFCVGLAKTRPDARYVRYAAISDERGVAFNWSACKLGNPTGQAIVPLYYLDYSHPDFLQQITETITRHFAKEDQNE